MRPRISELFATNLSELKLGARGISVAEVEQVPRNHHTTARNPRAESDAGERIFLIGRTDGGRWLTIVLERTIDPTSWLIVTGWESNARERRVCG